MLGAFVRRHRLALENFRVEKVARITRRQMQMIMPHILVARRLIVLTCGKSIAPVDRLLRDRNAARGRLNRGAVTIR